TARRALQERFRDGGRGFVAVGKPWPTYLQEGVRTGMTKGWAPERGRLDRGRAPGEGLFGGIGGAGIASHTGGARAWLDLRDGASRAEIAYLEQPGGGSFEIEVDGAVVGRATTRGERVASGYYAFAVPDGAEHRIEVRPVGDGEVRVFGVALSKAEHG